MAYLIGAVIGLIIGLVVGFLVAGRLNSRLEQGLLAEMRNLTAETLAEREKDLARRNEEQMKGLLAPMHQRLDDFRKAAEESKRTNGELGVKIGEFFKSIAETSQSFGRQAKSFTDALTGANKKQGNWGETILGQVLENCGLKEGEHFIAQSGSGAGIPDYQIFDPGSAKILILDSKMSWTKYEEAYRLSDGAARAEALKEHVQSVKRHIDELFAADYPHRQTPPRVGYTYVPLTAMFVPCDAALAAALESEPALVDYAFKRNVALVSPLTLFGFLKLVSLAWSRYNIDKNTNAIYDEAKKARRLCGSLLPGARGVGCRPRQGAREIREPAQTGGNRTFRTVHQRSCAQNPETRRPTR